MIFIIYYDIYRSVSERDKSLAVGFAALLVTLLGKFYM